MVDSFAVPLILALSLPQSPAPARAATPAEEPPPVPIDASRITEPTRIENVDPKWPDRALRAGLDGTVEVDCVIGLDGRVDEIKEARGYRILADAATAAVRKWRYTTAEVDGRPVRVTMTVTVNFRIAAAPRRSDLLAAIHDSDPDIRWAAVRWLGRYRPLTPKQVTALERATRDADERVRQAARQALDKLETGTSSSREPK